MVSNVTVASEFSLENMVYNIMMNKYSGDGINIYMKGKEKKKPRRFAFYAFCFFLGNN